MAHRKVPGCDPCHLTAVLRAHDAHEVVDAVGHPPLLLALYRLQRVRVGIEAGRWDTHAQEFDREALAGLR